jgi:hypothetical protein
LGAASNGVNSRIATVADLTGTDRSVDQRRLRGGWAVHLLFVTLAIERCRLSHEVIMGGVMPQRSVMDAVEAVFSIDYTS